MKNIFRFSTLVAIISVAFSANAFEAGTYTAQAQGQNGPVKVSVTFTKDKISKIEILEQKETVGIGSAAAPIFADKIVKNQSLNVDAVAGATATSNAIKKAVEDCVVQAKGNLSELDKKVQNTPWLPLKPSIPTCLLSAGAVPE